MFNSEALVWIWLAVFILSIVLEAATVDFVAIWFSIAALPSFIMALLNISFEIQLTFFVLVSILLLVFTRPYMVKYFKTNRVKTNAQTVIGKTAVVTEKILPNEIGKVKLRGISWSAISNDEIEKGSKVRVLDIEGVKLIVELLEKK
jgi:membrane protein implicated in regulation of membrane protease activity